MTSSPIRSALAFCLAAAALVAGPVHAQTKITLSHTGVADYAAAYVAADEGLFRRHGLDVTLLFAGGATSVPGLQAGAIQMATVPTTTLVTAVDNGLDMVAVAGTTVLDKADTNVGLVAGARSGIKAPADLLDKKVAVPSVGGFLHVMSRRWLANKGIDVKRVRFVEVTFPLIGNVLKTGTADAAVTADPFLKRIVDAGDASVLAYFAADLPPNTTGVVYATSREWASKNAAAVKGFRAAIAEAVALIAKEPQKARDAIGKYTKLPPELLATLPVPHLVADVSEPQLRFWVDAMREQGLLKGTVPTDRLIVR